MAISKRSRLIVPIDEARPSEIGLLGAKGACLAALNQAAVLVPQAVVLTTEVYAKYGNKDPLGSRALRELIREAYERVGGGRVAVRSSPMSANSAQRSFAGQYESYLGVKGEDELVQAVVDCWNSLSSESLRSYSVQADQDAPVEMAVIVQKMVLVDAAGILFTMDPVTGEKRSMVVECSWGLGTGTVTGKVVTDSFLVDAYSGKVLSKQVRYKPKMLITDGEGGTKEAPVQESRQEAQTISDASLERLVRTANKIRTHFGREMDIEWAQSGQQQFVLQARPITTTPIAKPELNLPSPQDSRVGTLWSRRNIGDMFDGVMTTLGGSFAEHYSSNVHGQCLRAMGLRELSEGSDYYRLFGGRLYANISYFAYLLSQTPLWRDTNTFTRAFTSEEFDLTRYKNPYGRMNEQKELLKSFFYWTKTQTVEFVTMSRRVATMVQEDRAHASDFERLNLPSLHISELGIILERELTEFANAYTSYLPIVFNAITLHGITSSLLDSWLGREGKRIAAELEGKMDLSLHDSDALLDLLASAKLVPAVSAILSDNEPCFAQMALEDDEAGKHFVSAVLQPFLREHGARVTQEAELTNPRWKEDATPIYNFLQSCLNDETQRDTHKANQRKFRFLVPDTVYRDLTPLRRLVLQSLVRLYELCADLRIESRCLVVEPMYRIRRLIFESGRRLVEQGLLNSLDDVAYTDLESHRMFLAGKSVSSEVFVARKIEGQRRKYFDQLSATPPPVTIEGEWFRPESHIERELKGVIKGVGSSPGTFTGRARVIEDYDQDIAKFEAGEVLVARAAQADWNPIFSLASAVITDEGSILSHGSILCREFNLPAVVGTKVATKEIRTGDIVTIDADQGTVKILPRK
jgi:prodigiosin/undecylprodigiosin synthetase